MGARAPRGAKTDGPGVRARATTRYLTGPEIHRNSQCVAAFPWDTPTFPPSPSAQHPGAPRPESSAFARLALGVAGRPRRDDHRALGRYLLFAPSRTHSPVASTVGAVRWTTRARSTAARCVSPARPPATRRSPGRAPPPRARRAPPRTPPPAARPSRCAGSRPCASSTSTSASIDTTTRPPPRRAAARSDRTPGRLGPPGAVPRTPSAPRANPPVAPPARSRARTGGDPARFRIRIRPTPTRSRGGRAPPPDPPREPPPADPRTRATFSTTDTSWGASSAAARSAASPSGTTSSPTRASRSRRRRGRTRAARRRRGRSRRSRC